jgi:hypothetical protein
VHLRDGHLRSQFLPISGPFHGLIITVLGSRSDFHDSRTPWCISVLVIYTRSFGEFWPIPWVINHRFGVPERFPRLTNPKVQLRVGHHYGVPERFPLLTNPKVHLRVGHLRSQFWSIFGPFHGLLITVLGCRSDFHNSRTLGCI